MHEGVEGLFLLDRVLLGLLIFLWSDNVHIIIIIISSTRSYLLCLFLT